MGIFDFFRRPKVNHTLDDRDRELSAKIRTSQAELKQRRAELEMRQLEQRLAVENQRLANDLARLQREYEELTEDDIPDEPESGNALDMMLMALVSRALPNPQQVAQPPTVTTTTAPPSSPAEVSISDEQFQEFWDSLGMFKQRMARKMSDDQLRTVIRGQVPNVDAESIERAIRIVRGK